MRKYQPLNILPFDIQRDWRARLERNLQPTAEGHFYLVNIRRAAGQTFEGQRVTILVVDENGFPIPNVPVAFSYSTAPVYQISQDFRWMPPGPQRAFVVNTQGSGQIDQIQGSKVRDGEPGGITVYMLTPEYSSDVVSGLGMLADHTGLHLTFQLIRNGHETLEQWQSLIEERLANVETKLRAITSVLLMRQKGQGDGQSNG